MSARTRASSPGGAVALYVEWIEPAPGVSHLGLGGINMAANYVVYAPVDIPFRCTVKGLYVLNGAAVGTDRWISAFYNSGGAPRAPTTRLAIGVATLTAGVLQRQYLPFQTPVQVNPGLYYTAVHKNGVTDTHYALAADVDVLPTGDDNLPQWYNESIAGPPANATPVALTYGPSGIWRVLCIQSVP